MILTILFKFYAYYAYHIYIYFLIDEAYSTAFSYVCLWEVTYSGSKFLHLFNTCYHMVGSSSEVSLSIFNDIKMESVKDKSGCYNVVIQVINRAKTITYQEICIYPGIEFILYDWYWYMAYTCAIDPSDDKFVFPEFAKTDFKSGYSRTDSRVSHMF